MITQTPNNEARLCPFHLPGSARNNELNSGFTCDEVTVVFQPAGHCCHAHRAEGSTAFQLFLGNPGGTVTCYLLLLAFFSPSPFSASALQLSHSVAHGSWVYSAPAACCIIPHFICQCYFQLMQMWGSLIFVL